MKPRISLHVALPCARDAFFQAATEPSGDYLHGLATDLDQAWQVYEQQVARPVRLLLNHARDLGLRTYSDATLADFSSASFDSDVLIVIAHWKGASIRASDIAGTSAAELAHRLLDRTSDAELINLAVRLDACRFSPVDLLNNFVDAPSIAEPADPQAFPQVNHPERVRAQRRDALDSLLNGLLRRGNCLEWSKGSFSDAETLEKALAPGFEGVLDLTSCTSVVPAAYISKQRRYACRVVQFEKRVDPELACMTLQQTLQSAVGAGQPYLRARIQAWQEMIDAFASGQ